MSHPYRKQRRAKREAQLTEPRPEPQLSADDKDTYSQCQSCGESATLDDTGLCKDCAGQDVEDLRYW